MKYIDYLKICNASNSEYEQNYSQGQYCHEQSFIWGFEEGIEWVEKEIIDKLPEHTKKLLLEKL